MSLSHQSRTAGSIWLNFFQDVRNCQENVFTKENFRTIHRKSRKSGCKNTTVQYYTLVAIG